MKSQAIRAVFERMDLPFPDSFADMAQGLMDVRRDDNRAYFNCAGGFKNVNAIRALADWPVTGTATHVLYGKSFDYSFSVVATANQNRLVFTMDVCTWEVPLDGSGPIAVVNSQSTGELMLTLPKGTRATRPTNWSTWGQSFLYVRDQG